MVHDIIIAVYMYTANVFIKMIYGHVTELYQSHYQICPCIYSIFSGFYTCLMKAKNFINNQFTRTRIEQPQHTNCHPMWSSLLYKSLTNNHRNSLNTNIP